MIALFTFGCSELSPQLAGAVRTVKSWRSTNLPTHQKLDTQMSCSLQDKSWVVILEISDPSATTIDELEFTKLDSGKLIELGSLKIPSTLGACQTPAESNQIKICWDNETEYEYQITYGPKGEHRLSIIRELGCENWPQRVKIANQLRY